MSGSFERQKYDTATYQKSLQESVGPMLYRLNPISTVRCDPCRPAQPGLIGRSGVSITHQRPLVDVESDLLQLHNKNSKAPSQNFQPTCPDCGECMDGYPCGGGVVAGCDNCQKKLNHLPACGLFTDATRISNPICTARGVGINRFQPMCLNPQDEQRWLHPSEVGISYRNVVKDNHVPCIPKPMDQSAFQPKGRGPVGCVKKSVTFCGVHREPMHKHGRVNRNWNNQQFS